MDESDLDPEIQALKLSMEKALEKVKDFVITPDRLLEDKKALGSGSFGSVRTAVLDKQLCSEANPHPRIVAVKRLHSSGDGEDRIRQGVALAREVRVWAKIEHPHIVPLLGFYWDPETDTALLISPYESMGTLFRYLANANPSAEKRLDLAIDTAEGLAYLHELNPPICHGDITSRNVVISSDLRAKLVDFGLAKVVEDHSSGLTTEAFHGKGTSRYRSPELYQAGETPRTLKSDVWAWACLLLEISTNQLPYHQLRDRQVTFESTKDLLPASLHNVQISLGLKALLVRCWETRPNDRPEIRQCLEALIRERSLITESVESLYSAPVSPADREKRLREALDGVLDTLAEFRMSEDWFEQDPITYPDLGDDKILFGRGTLKGPFRGRQMGDIMAVEQRDARAGDREDWLQRALDVAFQLKLWASWNHPNVVSLEGFFIRPYSDIPASVSQDYDSLAKYLKETDLNETDRLKLAIGTAKGLAYLHTRKPPVYHGNIHESNVAVHSSRRAMLCHFSLSAATDDPDVGLRHPLGGHYKYMAPELYNNSIRSLKTDIWTWGCLLLKILTGKNPYPRSLWMFREFSKKALPASPDDLSALPEALKVLLTECWQYEPESRPTIQHCLEVLTTVLVDLIC